LLLQVLDEGRLTDSFGRKVSFKNTILIMTSNLGTRDISKSGGLGFQTSDKKTLRETMERRINEEMKKTFSPEFINRLDETVVFNPLDRKDILAIVDTMLKDVVARVQERGMSISLTPGAKALVAEKGFDQTYGARQLKRTIQKLVEDPLAEDILRGRFTEGSKIRVSKKSGNLHFVDELAAESVDELLDKDKA